MKVMVIDDDLLLSETLKDIIVARGNQVKTFSNAEDAIEEYQHQFYSLILVDIGLPGIDGLECCKKLREFPKGKYSVLIVFTGLTQLESLRESLNAGADDYLKKPFDLETLKIRLEIAEKQGLDRLERMLSDEELKRARKMAESARMARNNFLANITHELRTPLNGILGYTQLLKRESSMLPKQMHAIDTIHECGEHLLTMINDVLDFSSIESQKFYIHPIVFDFSIVLKSIISIFRMKSLQKGILFYFEIDQNLPEKVIGDEKRLRQILLNLLSNAMKYTIKGHVLFRVKKDNSHVLFEIEDTGIGISEDNIEKIFQPFQQIKDERIQHEGAGLGLSITRTIIRKMGSEISVKTRLGQGTTFKFKLELPEALNDDMVKEKDSNLQITGYHGPVKKILIAEDIDKSRSFIREILEPIGFAIKEAVNGKEAIRIAYSFIPDLILMDLVMPAIGGIEATQKIRSIPTLKHTIIIAVSANISHETQQECFQAGCDDYITKPVQVSELIEVIQEHLEISWIQNPSPVGTDNNLETKPPSPSYPIIFPPYEEIESMNKLVLSGKTTRLKNLIQKIEDHYPQCEGFVKKVRQLLEDFRLEEIQVLINQRKEKNANVF